MLLLCRGCTSFRKEVESSKEKGCLEIDIFFNQPYFRKAALANRLQCTVWPDVSHGPADAVPYTMMVLASGMAVNIQRSCIWCIKKKQLVRAMPGQRLAMALCGCATAHGMRFHLKGEPSVAALQCQHGLALLSTTLLCVKSNNCSINLCNLQNLCSCSGLWSAVSQFCQPATSCVPRSDLVASRQAVSVYGKTSIDVIAITSHVIDMLPHTLTGCPTA